MSQIAILTDSCASIPEPLIKSLNIHMIAYYVHRGQEVLRDLVTIQRDEFLAWLDTAQIMPTTASPGPGDYFHAFQQLCADGVREVLTLHMTSKGSGAYQAARVAQEMAAEQLPQMRIEVIDSENVAMCLGWMVIEAARYAQDGMTMDEIIARIRRLIPVTQIIQTADTLKYLYLGGRIGKAAHLVGSILNIKPLISMKDGEIVALGVERSRRRAYEKMAEIIETAVGPGGKVRVAFLHAGAQAEVEKLREMVESRVNCIESIIAELSPALAVHTGRGTAGLCYFPVEN